MTAPSAQTPSQQEVVADRRFFGHPRGLGTLFLVEMWERFSFYGNRPLLVLFMTAALTSGGYGFQRPMASAIVGLYAFFLYIAALPGGWIADRWLGLQRSIWYGGVIIGLGHLSIGLSAFLPRQFFFLGLVLIVIGTGLLKPNISAIVGELYPDAGARRDAGFSVYYMGINTGALIAPLVTGLLGERYGWHWGFSAAGVGMLAGLITFRIRARDTLGPLGTMVMAGSDEQRRVRMASFAGVAVLAAIIVLTMVGVITINPQAFARYTTNIVLAVVGTYFLYLFAFAGLNTDEKKRVAVIIVLFLFATVFWSAFEQAPTSLNLFAKDFTNRNVLGFEVPSTWLQSINSFFVIALAPVFGALWVALAKRGREIASPAKFAAGLFMAGLAFYLMVIPANAVIAGGLGTRVSMGWLTLSYLLQTFGELSLSPVGLSSMTKLAPAKFGGQMMGIWFTASGLGNLIAGRVGGNIDPEKLEQMPLLFQRTAYSLFAATAVAILLALLIKPMMKNSPIKSY